MSDDDGFLATIIAHPEDDAPRLVYADWLEERGDEVSVARSEFIRVQCELAAYPKAGSQIRTASGMEFIRPGWEALRRRERELLESNVAWASKFASVFHPNKPTTPGGWYGYGGCGLGVTWDWHRGFIDSVTLRFNDFERNAFAMRTATPLQTVRLTTRPLGLVVGSPLLGTHGSYYDRICTLPIDGQIVQKQIQFLSNPLVARDRILSELLSQAYAGLRFTFV